jgi:acyl dehydratase
MINPNATHARVVKASVGNDPRFEGSIHDDESAEVYGFKGALVPGPIVTSYMSHLYVEAWGEDWLRRGRMTQRSRRPVYEGDTVTATAEPLQDADGALQVAVVLRNEAGEDVSFSTGELPSQPTLPPDLDLFPFRPLPAIVPPVPSGGHRPGDTYGSAPVLYTEEVHQDYLDKASETLDIYRRDGVVHHGFMLSLTMRDAIASYVKPTPGVHVSMSAQNYNLAYVGDTLSTSGHVVRVFEKNGHRYAESDMLVVANGTTPITFFRRTAIYALRGAPS